MKKILIGVDGGGSNSKLAVADSELNILHQAEGGPTNFLKIGIDEAVKNLGNLLAPIINKFADSYSCCVIGTAGAGRKEDASQLENELKKHLRNVNQIKVVSDAKITLTGAFENSNGAILIAGTGSILFYKNSNSVKRIGGFGRILGDEGSGYAIGKAALNHLAKVFDGRDSKSNLSEMLIEDYSLNSGDELIREVYKHNFDIASVARNVIDSAEKGDKIAREILESESSQLIQHIDTLINNENLSNLYLSFAGSLLTNKNYYSDLIKRKLNKSYPQIKLVTPKYNPEIGALLIAKELLK